MKRARPRGVTKSVHDVQLPAIKPDSYVAPTSVEETLEQLANGGRVLAGGTDLLIEMDRRTSGPVERLIDITRIAGLDKIAVFNNRVRIGPLVTHNQCVNSPVIVEHGLALAQACLEVGAPALRNRATVVGNIVTASPANDTISALSALEADITLCSKGHKRTVPLADFFIGVRKTVLQPYELVTDISFPIRSNASRSIFLKLGLRGAQAISVVHVALRCDFSETGAVVAAAIALGSVAPVIVRPSEAEKLLVGSALNPDIIDSTSKQARSAVSPIDDLRAPADYRSELVQVMVRRGLNAIAENAHRDAWPEVTPLLGGPNLGADALAAEFATSDTITTTINGRLVEAPWSEVSLLDWIRRETAFSGTKEGCAEGECGACTIFLDGVAVLSCLVPAPRAHQAQLTTIEGLAEADRLHPLQQGFVDCAAVQCGYCIPGLLMAGAALQSSHPDPDNATISNGLSGNLCRCGGYYAIAAAFNEASVAPSTPTIEEAKQ